MALTLLTRSVSEGDGKGPFPLIPSLMLRVTLWKGLHVCPRWLREPSTHMSRRHQVKQPFDVLVEGLLVPESGGEGN